MVGGVSRGEIEQREQGHCKCCAEKSNNGGQVVRSYRCAVVLAAATHYTTNSQPVHPPIQMSAHRHGYISVISIHPQTLHQPHIECIKHHPHSQNNQHLGRTELPHDCPIGNQHSNNPIAAVHHASHRHLQYSITREQVVPQGFAQYVELDAQHPGKEGSSQGRPWIVLGQGMQKAQPKQYKQTNDGKIINLPFTLLTIGSLQLSNNSKQDDDHQLDEEQDEAEQL